MAYAISKFPCRLKTARRKTKGPFGGHYGKKTLTPVGQIVLTETDGEMILSVIDEEGDVILEEIPGILEDKTESEEEE